MDFWDRLRDQIKERDLTYEKVARRLKIPIGTFKNWLLRKTYPDARKIVDIAKLLNTTAEYLVDGADNKAENIKLTDEDRQFVAGYRQLSKYDKSLLTLIIDAWNRRHKNK